MRRAAPLLHDAAKKYDIPLIQHDFPLKQHPWSFEAAVNARYFDTKSTKLGDEYRLFIFQNQNYVTKQNLHGMTEKWAEQHGVDAAVRGGPFRRATAKVEADRSMGNQIPLDHTPTIYIVTDFPHGAPVTEVKDMTQLYQMLDQITQQAKQSAPAPTETKAQEELGEPLGELRSVHPPAKTSGGVKVWISVIRALGPFPGTVLASASSGSCVRESSRAVHGRRHHRSPISSARQALALP